MTSLFNRLFVSALGLAPKSLVKLFAKRYIAGDTLSEAVSLAKKLNERGIMGTFDVLGEEISRLEDARAAIDEYKKCLRAIADSKLDANISLKPTQFGLGLDPQAAEANIREVVREASALGIFVRIDMEDSRYTEATFQMYRRIREDYPKVGTVMQAYLRNSMASLEEMLDERLNLRLCKGIYIEPRKIAFKLPELINRNYTLLLDAMLAKGAYVGIATHDERLVFEARRLIREHKRTRESYEFQMLLGVDEELRDIILDEGHRLRLYIPYGTRWYPYSMRRLRENPKIAMYILQNMLG